MNIKDIEAIGEKFAKLLENAGYSKIEDLLSLTKNEMKKLAKKTGISEKLIDTWQEIADLMRIDGVGPELAEVLNKIGIDSIKELAQRNAENTLNRIKVFVKGQSDIIQKMPTLTNVKDWIEQATLIKLGKSNAKKKKVVKDEGEYGPDYWNNKWEKAPIIYTGRALRGESYYKQIDADVKSFIIKNDEILRHVIEQANLKKSTYNETALMVQKFVCEFLVYKYDEETADCPEFWQFPFESIQSGIGDCIAVYEEIYTENGIKKVGDLQEGERVLSYDFDGNEFCYKKIIKIWEKGKLDIYRVLFRNGQSIDVSINHPFWIRQNQKESKYEKVYLRDIDLSKWWKRKTPIAKKIPYAVKDIEWLTEDLCLVLGHYLAEGWKEKDGRIRSSGYDLLDDIIPILEQNEIPYSEYTNASGVPCISILKSEFKEFLRTVKDDSFNIHLPEVIFHLPPNKLQAIINGFYIGDGHWGNYPDKRGYKSSKQEVLSTSSKQLAEDIQRIGLQLNKTYHIWKQINHKGAGKRPIYRITYNPKSHFLKDYGFHDISEVSVREYQKIGVSKMRDFQIEDTNSFVFKNGIIGHNCEDGAILIASLLINAGIPSWRVKVCGGSVSADPVFAPSSTELGGHAWAIYLADRSDSQRGVEWVILDWCYAQDPDIPIEEKPLARDGGQHNGYKEIWFTFNDEYSWSQTSFGIKEGRISNKRKVKKAEVLTTIKDVLKNLAEEQIEKVLKKYGIKKE